jgi:hypothetical protein
MVAAAGALIMVAAGAVVAAIVPLTDTKTGIVDVPAGQCRCVDPSTKELTKAPVDDFVTSGHKVKFVFMAKPDNASDSIEIGDSGPDLVSSYSKMITAQTHPSLFPGVFRTCARNLSNKPSTDSLTVTVDK